MPGRSPRQCRDRHRNYLLDSLVTSPWTPEEDAIIIAQFHVIGPRWVEIAKSLSGRSGSHVKNRWHRHLCRPAAVPERRDVSIARSDDDESGRDATEEILLCPAVTVASSDWPKIFSQIEEAAAGQDASGFGQE
jgi:hypothetical protein